MVTNHGYQVLKLFYDDRVVLVECDFNTFCSDTTKKLKTKIVTGNRKPLFDDETRLFCATISFCDYDNENYDFRKQIFSTDEFLLKKRLENYLDTFAWRGNGCGHYTTGIEVVSIYSFEGIIISSRDYSNERIVEYEF